MKLCGFFTTEFMLFRYFREALGIIFGKASLHSLYFAQAMEYHCGDYFKSFPKGEFIMLTTSAPLVSQGDPVALAMVLVLAVVVAVMALRKHQAKKHAPAPAAKPVTMPASAAQVPTAPGSAGRLKIHNVPPKTAAMLMAITADKLGKPLNGLRFISIKEVTEHEV